MAESGEKIKIPLPVFTGQRDKFAAWWISMQAFAVTYGFEIALRKETASLPATESEEIDMSTPEGVALARGKSKNNLAMSYLVHALRGETLLRYIIGSKSAEWPSGRAWVLIDKLKKKYAPEDLTAVAEFKLELKKVKFGKPNDDPDKMFEQLARIQNKYMLANVDIDWNDVVATVIGIVPQKYQMLLVKYATKKDNTQETYEALENEITQYYRQTKAADGATDEEANDEPELSLVQSDFKGTCFKCKRVGHRASECKGIPRNDDRGGRNSRRGTKSQAVTCRHCGKKGHVESGCWLKNPAQQPEWFKKKMEKKEQHETGASQMNCSNTNLEVLLGRIDYDALLTFPESFAMISDPNVFVADTGASAHSTSHLNGLFDLEEPEPGATVVGANGKHEKVEKIAKLHGTICSKTGDKLMGTLLKNVQYVPTQGFNLFSLTKAMNEGWRLASDNKKNIIIHKGKHKIVFDLKIPTRKGFVCGVYIARNVETAATNLQAKVKMSVMNAHDRLGHINEAETRKIAKALGWELSPGAMGVCEACTIAKAKQKNVPKESEHVPAGKPNERIFLDIATIKKPKEDWPIAATNVWRVMVDERTQLKFSDFFTSKNAMIEPTCVKLDKWRNAGMPVSYIRLDNAGENLKLKQRAESSDWKLGIDFEFTARDTPQQNHLAELAFAVLANRGRAVMLRANVPLKWRYKLFPEAFKTVTLLDGLVPIMVDNKLATRFEHWRGTNPSFAKHLRTWGEAGTVKTRGKMTPKLADRGTQCMFVGYALDHAGDCYRMWDPKTGRIHVTRDIIWLKRMFFKPEVTPMLDSGVVIEFDREHDTNVEAGEGTTTDVVEPSTDTTENVEENVDENTLPTSENNSTMAVTRSGRTIQPPRRLIEEMGAVSYEVELSDAEKAYYDAMKTYPEEYPCELSLVGAGIGGGFTNTNELHVMKYNEAMASADKEKFEKAVEEEHDRMIHHRVFKPVPISEVPKGEKIITSTWAIKKKSNGTYRARLNARGFEQVDGIHYREDSKSSPVVSDITIRIVLVLAVMAKMYMEVLDVKGAFLHGEFEDGEKIYMKIPQGFEKYYPANYVWLLLTTLYGLKQAALAFWRKLVITMAYIRFKRSKADPCLYFKWTDKGLTLITSVVDDMNITGDKDDVIEAKKGITSIFECDEVGETKEYVGLKLDYNPEAGYVKITQPVLLQSLADEFDVPKNEPIATPGVPGEYLKSEPIDTGPEEQRIYRSGVGKLIHLAKWSRVEASNAVRELTKFAGVASKKHMDAMKRVMRYMLDTPNRGLLLQPTARWNGDRNFEFTIRGRSDADWAKDPDTRRSVSGYTTFLEDAPVAFKCAGQRFVTISSAESELGSATSCAQDMLFVMRVLESIGLRVKKPMILEIDNQGAIDWTNSWSVGGRMRHIDVREHFLRDLREDGLIEVKWIASEDNSSDLLTKNLPGPLFEKHATVYCGYDEYMQYAVRGEGVGKCAGPD